MRIEGQTNFSMEKLFKGSGVEKSNGSFANILNNSSEKLHYEALSRLVKLVDLQGEKLIKHRTIENFRDYKKFIQRFVQEAVSSGLHLADRHDTYADGNVKTVQIIEVIDDKLLELYEEVMNMEEDRIAILSLVGEIKGLIINLYM